MRVLVAGGAGFLGSHFCDYLLSKGDSVICADTFKTGSETNISHLFGNRDFKFLHWDVNDIIKVECDAVVHMASPTAPADFKLYPDLTIRSNSVGTLNLLCLAQELNSPMLFISTIRVRDNEDNPYVTGKQAGEILCENYEAKVARCGNIYGKRMNKYDSRVIPTFVRKAKENQKLTLFGDGVQLDSFLYVDDAMNVFYRFLTSTETGVIEIGGEVATILEMASRIISKTFSKSELDFRPAKVAYKQRALPDLSLALEKLKWFPAISLSDGLDKFIQG